MPSLQFKGKTFVDNHHLSVPFHELRPVAGKGTGKNASLHDNLVIHGDNLAALKALLPTYHNKVKCIYIDPPYNTGNEGWAYNDNVNSPMMQDWLGKTVDRDDLTRHDKWCCMMLPRLKLLRELLRQDGVIFISIDDNEVHHLRDLMDEVFGDENFVATTIWEKVYSPKSTAKHFSDNHDFIVVYARDKIELDADNRIWWGKDQNQVPAVKRFLSEVKKGLVPQTIWTYRDVGHTQDAKKILLQIFPDDLPEFTAKPVELLKRIVLLATDEDSIVLDSFAGSGTTAHAVLALNQQDGGNRRFVLVECEDYADSITAERVRRVIKGVPSAKEANLKAGLGGSFSYFELGAPMQQESLLSGCDLPDYEALAAYVFFTATGEQFDPRKINPETRFIGTSRRGDVYLIYEPDRERIKDLALTLDFARSLPKPKGTNRLVFAPTKYLDQEFLDQYRITFCQLPFQIYQAIDASAGGGVRQET